MSHIAPSILHLRASNFVGGPERQILRYCGSASAAAPAGGWRQILATFTRATEMGSGENAPGVEGSWAGGRGAEGEAWLREARAAGQEAWALPGGGWRDLRALAALDRLLREQRVALICTHGYRADLLGTLAARRRRIPVAWFLRGWTGESRRVRAYEGCDRALLGAADRVVCLSRAQAAALPQRIARDRVHVVVNAVETVAVDRNVAARDALLRRFAIADENGKRPPLVAIAGRLSPEKGAAVFLEAARRVHRQRPEIHFLVFGDGPLRPTLEAESRRLGLEGCFRFAGHVSGWTRLLPGLDLLVNPSLREQAPNVVLEAMAAAVPVLATAVGAVAEIAGVGSGAPPSLELVPPGAPESLAAAMVALMDDPRRRIALGIRGWNRVREAYSPQRQQGQLHELYRGLLAPEASGAPAPASAVLPSVSIVLPVRNEAPHLAALLEQLLGQDYPAGRYEILIADGGSPNAGDTLGDGTTALAQDYARRFAGRIRWLPNLGRTSSSGRNCGLAAARGEWIVFVDGHCTLPGATWLSGSLRAARQSGALCLSRPQPLTAERGREWQAVIAHARATRIGHGADSTIYGASASGWVNPASSAAAYHRSLFERVGWYDEGFDACEDVEFNYRLARAGVRAWLCPGAVVNYAARSSLRGLWLQMVRYGRGRVRLVRKHRDALSVPQCLPALWLAWLPLALAGTVLGRGGWRIAAAAGLLLYAGVIAAYAIGLGRRYGGRHLFGAPAVYFTIHAGLGAGAWRELLSRRRSVPAAAGVGAALEPARLLAGVAPFARWAKSARKAAQHRLGAPGAPSRCEHPGSPERLRSGVVHKRDARHTGPVQLQPWPGSRAGARASHRVFPDSVSRSNP